MGEILDSLSFNPSSVAFCRKVLEGRQQRFVSIKILIAKLYFNLALHVGHGFIVLTCACYAGYTHLDSKSILTKSCQWILATTQIIR